MNEDQKENEINEMTQLLIRLRPARGELDSRVVFYEAGFSAGQAAVKSPRRQPKLALLIAAGLLAAVVTAPASYRLGQTSTISQSVEPAEPADDDSVTQQHPRVDQSPPDAPPDAGPPEAGPPEVIDPPSNPQLFARWIEPLSQLAGRSKRDVSYETTLAAFHGASISRDQADRDWLDDPFASTLARYRDFSAASAGSGSELVSPLTVSDLRAMTQSLETAR